MSFIFFFSVNIPSFLRDNPRLKHDYHFFLRIFLLFSGVIQGIEETDLLVFDGTCFFDESGMKEVNKPKLSLPSEHLNNR